MADKIVGAIVAKLKLDAKQFQAQMKAARAAAGGLGTGLQTIGKGFVKAAAATAGFAIALGAVVKVSGDFEQTMVNVGAVTGATGDDLKELSSIAVEMGKATIFSASQAGDAMFALGSQGIKTADDFRNVLKPALDLAAATQSEIASTTESVIGNLRAFGLGMDQAGRLANVFSAANENSALTMDRLANALRPVAPLAGALEVSFEKTAAVLGVLVNRNFQAEEAGTALRNIFLRLAKPVGEAAKILQKAGLTTERLGELTKEPVELIKALRDANLSNADAITIFGARAVGAFIALRDGVDDIEKLEEAITGTDSATRIAARQLDTFNSQVKLLKSALEALFITIGTDLLPAFRSFVERMTENTKKIIEFVEKNRVLVKGLIFSTGKWLAITTAVFGTAAVLGKIILVAPAVKAAILAITAGSPWILLAVAVGIAINAIVDIIGKIFEAKGEAAELAQKTENLNKKYQQTSAQLRKVAGDWDEANALLKENGIKIGFVIKNEKDLIRALKVLEGAQQANIEKDKSRTEGEKFNAEKRVETTGKELQDKLAALLKNSEESTAVVQLTAEAAKEIGRGFTESELEEFQRRKEIMREFVEGGQITWGEYYLWLANEGVKFNDAELGRWQAYFAFVDSILSGIQSSLSSGIASMINGSKKFAGAVKQIWEGIKRAVIKAISDMIAKWIAFTVLKKVLSFGIFHDGGMVPGAQEGMLPRGEDLLIGVQSGEGILSRAGVAAIGGAGGVEAINNAGAGKGKASVGGDTFVFHVESIDGTINEGTREAIIRMIQDEKRRFAGALV